MSNTLDSIYGVYSHRHSILFEYMSFYNKKLFTFLRVRLPLEDGKTLFGELLFLSVILAVCKDGHFLYYIAQYLSHNMHLAYMHFFYRFFPANKHLVIDTSPEMTGLIINTRMKHRQTEPRQQ